LDEQFDEIALLTQYTEQEDEQEGSCESEQFIYYRPESAEHKEYDIGIDIGLSQQIPPVKSTSNLMSNDDYLQLVRSINFKQKEFFLHVLHWIKTKDVPIYAFVTGGAGVGKSVVIKALYQVLRRYLSSDEGENPDDCKLISCAPTGKAAYNINGATIYAAFKIRQNQSYYTILWILIHSIH